MKRARASGARGDGSKAPLFDVLEELVRSGDLDANVIDLVPTFTLHGAAVEWRPDEPSPRSLLPDDLSCPSG